MRSFFVLFFLIATSSCTLTQAKSQSQTRAASTSSSLLVSRHLKGKSIRKVNLSSELKLQRFKYQDLLRSYYLYDPTPETTRKRPLFLVLHGGGKGDGKSIASRTSFLNLAKEHRFLIAFPNGVDQQWNDGRGKSFRKPEKSRGVDDVGFLVQLVQILIRSKNVHPSRVYLTGASNGGMMSYRMACEASPFFAGIAPMIGGLPKNLINSCNPRSRLPILSIMSDQDPWVPYEGGKVTIARRSYGDILSALDSIRFFLQRNHCAQNKVSVSHFDRVKGDNSSIEIKRWKCPGEIENRLITVVNGGHSLPGNELRPFLKRILGNSNQDLDAAKEVVRFLLKYRLPTKD